MKFLSTMAGSRYQMPSITLPVTLKPEPLSTRDTIGYLVLQGLKLIKMWGEYGENQHQQFENSHKWPDQRSSDATHHRLKSYSQNRTSSSIRNPVILNNRLHHEYQLESRISIFAVINDPRVFYSMCSKRIAKTGYDTSTPHIY